MSENSYDILEDEIRGRYASVVWSHKIQEKQADIYLTRYKHFETAKIASASLTSVGIVSLLFTDQLWIKIVSAVISFVSVFVSAYFKSFDLTTFTKAHKSSANQLLRIRDKLQLLLVDVRAEFVPVKDVRSKYEELLNELHTIYNEAPNTTDKAVQQARKALKITKDNSFADDEIDSFLPKELRKGR